MKRLANALLVMLLVVIPMQVKAGGPGTTSMAFLKINPGARPAGMGIFTSVSDDANCLYWNVGGTGFLGKRELSGTHIEWLEDINYETLSFIQPLGKLGTLGINLNYLYVDGIPRTKVDGNGECADDGVFGMDDKAAMLVYGKRLAEQFGVGVSFKYVRETLDSDYSETYAFDFGLLYKGKINIGLAIRNIGTDERFISGTGALPLTITAGISIHCIKDSLLLGVELTKPYDNDLVISSGVEFTIFNVCALRAGYQYKYGGNDLGPLSGLRAGAGIKAGWFLIDYAYVPYSDLGEVHRMSVGIKL